MPGYVIADVEITDAAAYEEYRHLVPATVEKYGGKYVVRGGAIETREGGWAPPRFVVIEFSSVDQARRWYDSPEYRPARDIRQRASKSKVIIAEGLG